MPVGVVNNLATRGYLSVYGGGSGPIGGGIIASITSFTETIITPEILGAIPYPNFGGVQNDPEFKVGNKVVSIVFLFEGRYIQKSVIVNKDLKVTMDDFRLQMVDDIPTVEFQFKK